MKRTPLKRKAPLLQRTEMPRSRDRMEAVSARRRRRDAPYAEARGQVWERSDGRCEAPYHHPECRGLMAETHHLAGRNVPEPHGLSNLVGLSVPCHQMAHANPGWAYDVGLMRTRLGGAA